MQSGWQHSDYRAWLKHYTTGKRPRSVLEDSKQLIRHDGGDDGAGPREMGTGWECWLSWCRIPVLQRVCIAAPSSGIDIALLLLQLQGVKQQSCVSNWPCYSAKQCCCSHKVYLYGNNRTSAWLLETPRAQCTACSMQLGCSDKEQVVLSPAQTHYMFLMQAQTVSLLAATQEAVACHPCPVWRRQTGPIWQLRCRMQCTTCLACLRNSSLASRRVHSSFLCRCPTCCTQAPSCRSPLVSMGKFRKAQVFRWEQRLAVLHQPTQTFSSFLLQLASTRGSSLVHRGQKWRTLFSRCTWTAWHNENSMKITCTCCPTALFNTVTREADKSCQWSV